MNITLEKINQYIPREVTDRLPRKKFQPGEVILKTEDRHILFLLNGSGRLIRYQGDKKITLHFNYKKNTIVGFNMLLSPNANNWEFLSTKHGEAVIIPYDIIEKYIFNVADSFKFFYGETLYILEDSVNSFYILAHGGAKACLAFLFIRKAKDNHFIFERYEDFSEILGISKSMLYRITKSLIDEKLIKKERKSIIILDSEGLISLYKEFLYI